MMIMSMAKTTMMGSPVAELSCGLVVVWVTYWLAYSLAQASDEFLAQACGRSPRMSDPSIWSQPPFFRVCRNCISEISLWTRKACGIRITDRDDGTSCLGTLCQVYAPEVTLPPDVRRMRPRGLRVLGSAAG